jgi:hypothetical protein
MKVGMPRIPQRAGGAVRLHCGAQRDCAMPGVWLPCTGCGRTMVHMNSKGLIGVPGQQRPWFGLLAAAMLACGGLAGCQTQGEVAQQENSLAAAGFVVQIANTAERQAMLQRLPPNRFVVRVHDGVTHYIYADPDCGCLYVGPQQAFNQYISNQQLDLAHEQQMAVQDYYDASWDWAAWGPWGPLGPIYGSGVGGW